MRLFLQGLFFTLFSITYTQAQNTELWGTTSNGGINDGGTIFSVDANGNNLSIRHNFSNNQHGEYPSFSELCEADNGKFYGLVPGGGILEEGVLFEYDPVNHTYISKIEFNINTIGGVPEGSLVKSNNGKLYGMTTKGGSSNNGVLFEYDPINNTYTIKVNFDGVSKGSEPHGTLTAWINDKLYGMTHLGGTYGKGVLFEYDPANDIFTKKLDFDGTSKGSEPFGALVQSSSNLKMYGMTAYGGASDYGVVFEFDPDTDTYTKLLDFDGSAHGRKPYGTFVEADNGKMYGMTYYGGSPISFPDLLGDGTLIELDPATGIVIKKLDLAQMNTIRPSGSLAKGDNGKLYGMTSDGGAFSYGTLFEYDPSSNVLDIKVDFDNTDKGSNPLGSLMKSSNGLFYGLTYNGGTNNSGVLFEYDATNNLFQKRFDLNPFLLGISPYSSLIQADNGKLYGTARYGGTIGDTGIDDGILFEYDPLTYSYTKIIDFEQQIYGSAPTGSVMQASNGKLYGLTSYGGSYTDGVLYEYDIVNDDFTKLVNFDWTTGQVPLGALVQAGNGKLYGMTVIGGSYGNGVMFEYDINTGTYTEKVQFDGTNFGALPYGSLLLANNGKLYGMTTGGGAYGIGVLFEYDPNTNTFTKKQDFDGTNKGASPWSTLMQADNGKLYGVTKFGGTFDLGVFFEYDISTNALVKKMDFDGVNFGSEPFGTIVQSSNNNLYGMANKGGTFDDGVLYEYNLNTESFIKKMDFDSTSTGGNPQFSGLLEIEVPATRLYVDHTATGTNDGSSWANAFTDLQSALAVASNQEVHIAQGTYYPTSGTQRGISFDIPTGASLFGGYPSGGSPTPDPATYTTTLSGNIDGIAGYDGNSFHVIKIVDATNVTLDGLTIKEGGANDASSFGRARGGGVYTKNATATFNNVNFKWNRGIYGGGIFSTLSPNITFQSCEFKNNTADYGAAIYHSNETQMFINQTSIINNTSFVRCAIEVNNSLYTRLDNSLIANNISTNANALGLIATNRDQSMDIYNCTILGEAKDRYVMTLQIGYGDQLDISISNTIIAHQNLAFAKAVKAFNNGALNLQTQHCYIQGNSIIGTSTNNLYSDAAGDLMLNADYSVNECSPVINAGNNSLASGTQDIAGNTRIFSTVDMGCFEAQVVCSNPKLSQHNNDNIQLYPNPTSGTIHIKTSLENINIIVWDGLGKKLLESQENEINLSSFPQGIYFFEIRQNGELLDRERIIKQ